MHSYVTPGNDAPRGVRKRGLSKGKAGSVREQVESWKVRGKVGRVGNLAKSRGSLWVWYWYWWIFVRLEGGAREGIGTPGSGKERGRGGRRKSLVLVLGPWYY